MPPLRFANFAMLFVFVVVEKMKIFVCDERTHTKTVYYVRSATKVLNWFSFWCAKDIRGKTPNKTVLIKIFRLRAHNLIETPQSTYFVFIIIHVCFPAAPPSSTPFVLTHKSIVRESRLHSLSSQSVCKTHFGRNDTILEMHSNLTHISSICHHNATSTIYERTYGTKHIQNGFVSVRSDT